MKVLERIKLIDKIARELQSRMTFADIKVYLSAFGIDCKNIEPSVNSKYVYVKELLANEDEDLILRIADELEIEHGFSTASPKEVVFWKPGYFRLFLSHLASFKKKTSTLQTALRKYGVSAFVAHEDIEPSKELQIEIEAALQTMDAMAALLMPGFKESNWCDQEIGVAVGRNVLVIPIRRGLDPYGFIAKYQGVQAMGKTIGQVAEEIFQALVRSPKTRQKILRALSSLIANGTIVSESEERLEILSSVENIPVAIIEGLKQQAIENTVLVSNESFISNLNKILSQYDIEKIIAGHAAEEFEWSNDIPF